MPLGEVGAAHAARGNSAPPRPARLLYPDAMALEVGIVGLPNSGKTTLFNALTRAGAAEQAGPGALRQPPPGALPCP